MFQTAPLDTAIVAVPETAGSALYGDTRPRRPLALVNLEVREGVVYATSIEPRTV